MEESAPNNLPPAEDILTPQDTLEPAANPNPNVIPAPGTSLESSGLPAPSAQPAVPQQPIAPTPEAAVVSTSRLSRLLQNILLRRVALASGILIIFIGLLVGSTYLFQRTHKVSLSPGDRVAQIKDQPVNLPTATLATGPSSLRVGVSTLFVNGDISAQGVLRFSNGINYVQLNPGTLTGNHDYTLPNASGTICLDSNNCGYASTAQVSTLLQNSGAGGVTSVNGSTGAIVLQGANNSQITATNSGGTITFSLPQNISSTSTPTFNGITLSAVGTQNGNILCDISNNCGFGGSGSILQGGNSFGTAVSIGANDNFGLNFRTNNTVVASFSNTGQATFKNASDSTTAFQIQNSLGASLLNVNSTANQITLLGNTTGELNAWSTSGNSLPAGRYAASSAISNGYAYVLGGVNGATVQNSIYYAKLNADGSTDTWNTNATTLPRVLFGQATVVSNGYIYVIGGEMTANSALATVSSARINVDGTIGAWTDLSNSLPAARSGTTAVISSGYVFVFGGVDAAGTPQTSVYSAKLNADGTVGAWVTSVNSIPAARVVAGTVVSNGYVYLVGGSSTGIGANPTNTVYYAKLNADGTIGTWTTSGNTLPAARSNGTAVAANGYIYYIAGSNGTSPQTTVYYSKANVDGSVGGWSTATNSIPSARYIGASVSLNGYIYWLGGADSGGLASASVFYASIPRVQVGGNLDLVGLQGINLSDGGDGLNGATGGAITASNGVFVGSLQVQGSTALERSLLVGGNLTTNGGVLFRNSIDSAMALQLQNAAGTNLFQIDTTNNLIYVGNSTADTTGTLLVVDTKSNAGDPTGVNGGMYYNANSNKFRCYQNGSWQNCISTAGSGTGDINQGGNAFGANVVLGATDNFGLSLITNNTARLTVSNAGAVAINATGAAGTVEEFRINTPNTVDNNTIAILTNTGANTNKILTLQGVAGQFAPFLATESNTGTILSSIDLLGNFRAPAGTTTSPGFAFQAESTLGLFRPASGVLAVTVNAETARFTSQGLEIGSTGSQGTVEKLRVGTPTTTDNLATSIIATGGAANRGLVIQGGASQVADLFQAQTSAGVILYQITAAGASRASGSGVSAPAFAFAIDPTTGFFGPSAGQIGISSAGTEVARFSSQGLEVGSTGTPGTVEKFRVGTPTTVDNSAKAIIAINTTTTKGLVIQGVAAQSANLQEWQASDGTVLGSIGATGSALLQNSANSTTAFRVQNAAGTNLLQIDTSNNVLYVGNSTPDSTGTLLVVDNKNTAGDPTGINGAIYYNSSANKFRCFENSLWKDCAGTGGTGTGDVNNGGNTFGSTMSLGTLDGFGLNFLVNSATVMTYSTTGQATFKNASDSTTAFQIQNAAATSLFTVDSSNARVYVGNPTADATGTLLVLDTKNTAGDPTGVNGAMYYNSNTGKFRCFEGGAWTNCIYSVQTATKAGDQTFSATSYADVTNLSFSVLANTVYKLQCTLLLSVPSGTNGGNLSTNGPAAPTQYTATFAKTADQSSGDNYATSTSYDDGSVASVFKVNTVSNSNRFVLNYSALLVNGASSGTWTMRAKAFDGSSSITVYANSSCDLKPL